MPGRLDGVTGLGLNLTPFQISSVRSVSGLVLKQRLGFTNLYALLLSIPQAIELYSKLKLYS